MKLVDHGFNLLMAAALLVPACDGLGQAVAVTMSLDNPTVSVGQNTTLHIYAQVVPNIRTNADRIFFWYVDVLNTNGAAASANYAAMQKTASDQDSLTSSTGTADGANRRGIYDSFLNYPGAGVTNPVELMRITVTGQAAGQTRFLVQHGTGASGLSSDFLVQPKSGTDPYIGGDYTAAFVDLTVIDIAPCTPQLHLAPLSGTGGLGSTLQLTFTPCPGRNHTMEYRSALGDVTGWQSLPGAPHNSGSVTVTNSAVQQYYRLRIVSP